MKAMESNDLTPETHALGAVVQATGLSADLLRAWESRYAAVVPLRSPGGTRRYRDQDITRLRLLKSAVAAGHRIGEVVSLSDRELIRRIAEGRAELQGPVVPALDAVHRVDTSDLQRICVDELHRAGAPAFVKDFAIPLLQIVGDEWAAQRLSVASEHLASSVLSNLLGSVLVEPCEDPGAPHVVFSTPKGERHDLGTLAAAVVAVSLGLHATYLGPDLPVAELSRAAADTRASAVSLGVTHQRVDRVRDFLAELDGNLPRDVEIWVGGAGYRELGGGRIHSIPNFEVFEEKVRGMRSRPE